MEAIVNILDRIHRLQRSCFGTPITVEVQTSKVNESGKMIYVSLFAGTALEESHYRFYSDQSKDDLYQTWGDLNQNANLLLDKYVGHKVNRNGRLKQE